jgi:hypothetical protein
MSPEDCYEVGAQVFTFGDYAHAASWLREALYRLEDYNQSTSSLKIKILRLLPVALHKIGSIKTALFMTTDWLNLQPNDTNARVNQMVLSQQLKSGNSSVDSIKSSLESIQVSHKFY